MDSVRAEVQEVSYKRPGQVLVGLNSRDPRFHDVYRLDLAGGWTDTNGSITLPGRDPSSTCEQACKTRIPKIDTQDIPLFAPTDESWPGPPRTAPNF